MAVFGFTSFLVYAALFMIGQNIIGHRRRAANILRTDSLLGLAFMMVFASAWPFSCVLLKGQHPHPIAIGCGLALTCMGLGLSLWSQMALGQYWVGGVGLHKNHRLVTTGPFRFVRHPMYTGMLMSTLGLGIASWNIVYALTGMCFSIRFALRAPAEDAVLREKFRKQYPPYAERTGMFLPKIRK